MSPTLAAGPTGVYGAALRDAVAGRGAMLHLISDAGDTLATVNAGQWRGLCHSDGSILRRCGARTLDVGCGPGRLTAALIGAGRYALGVDVSAEAVRQARRRGAWALRRDVFGQLPDEGGWDTVLLADGNVGIGGDPTALLTRCRELLRADGWVLVEVATGASWRGMVRLRYGERHSEPFPWASVSLPDIAAIAGGAGLEVSETWRVHGRWFTRLARRA